MGVLRVPMNRRTVLGWLGAAGIVPGCVAEPALEPREPQLPGRDDVDWPDAPAEPFEDADEASIANVRALMDVLIPTERDQLGELIAPGALEAGAMEMLELSRFLPSARSLALIPEGSVPGFEDLETFDAALRALLSADLDALAFELHPLTPFRSLQRHEQESVVRKAFSDPLTRPMLLFARAAAFVAFLGAAHNDLGLIYVGFPPFEDFEAGIATRGYPRTADGRLVDPEAEDLAALEAADLVAFRYLTVDGEPAGGAYPANPNGSPGDVAGVTDSTGLVLGLMPHPEDHVTERQDPLRGRTASTGSGLCLPLFEAGVAAVTA